MPVRTRLADSSKDIDLIVDADPNVVQTLLLEADPQFRRTDKNSIVFETVDDSVPVELLRGGNAGVLRLPDPRTVSLLSVTAQDQPGRGIDKTPSEYLIDSLFSITAGAFANLDFSPRRCTIHSSSHED